MGHTPGPWKFDKEYGNAMDEVYGPDGRAIAAVWTRKSASGSHSRADYSPFEQGTANARLIAAAPDLLEVCCEVLLDLQGRRLPVSLDRQEQLRAAIAKAKGEQ